MDKKRWVLWTPEGFFDHSPGGESLIGYVVNRSEEQASEYVQIDQLYDRFYRPDLVRKRLEGTHEDEIREKRRGADIESILTGGLPPSVDILYPRSGEKLTHRDIRLKVKLTDRGGGYGRMVYRINGITVGTDNTGRGIQVTSATVQQPKIFEKLISLQPGENHISIAAFNRKNEIESRPVTVQATMEDALSKKPSLFILTIGIDSYRDRSLQLKYSVNDARTLIDTLQKNGENLFQSVQIETLFNKQATRKNIESTFDRIAKKMNTSDVFVCYMAGHGLNIDGRYNFVPWDMKYQNESSLEKYCLDQTTIQDLLSQIPAFKSLILLDTCSAGAFTQPYARGLAAKGALDKLMRTTGRATLAASSEVQVAFEGYKGHGVFTYALIEGLNGEADRKGNRNGEISVNELAEYVSERVPQITLKNWGYEQFPMQNIHGRSFPIAIVN